MVKKTPLDQEKSFSEEIIDKVHSVQENIKKGEMPFKHEIEHVKTTAVGKGKQLTTVSKKVFLRCTKNWDVLLGIPFLAYGLFILWDIIAGLSFVIVGLLCILGYVKKRYKNDGMDMNE